MNEAGTGRRTALLVVISAVLCSPLAVAQEAGVSSLATQESAESIKPDDADHLDKLLEIADQDVSQLTRVKVTAPSLQTEVTTVSRQKSTVGRSPAAVFVITNEMIRRSTARSIPEALRMAPGVNVARIDANKWAISIRGFNGRFANKLLVQIDGRPVYTPLFGGVFWDVQDVLLEDVERIEVIRGPGATVWGVNAVNGVINIITKDASTTQGVYAEAGGGTEDRDFASARYGGQLGENATYRVYGKWFERDQGYAPGDTASDDWRMGRGGFRLDWTPDCCDTVTVQGDAYEGGAGSRSVYPTLVAPFTRIVEDDSKLAGGNALFRWTRELSDQSDWSLQAFYDRTERHFQAIDFREDRDTLDVDFQHRFQLGWNHKIIWGARYRNTRDRIRSVPLVLGFQPGERADDLFSYFLQDQITLREDLLYLTLGSKFSHGDYTPFEFQPTARLLWTPTERHSIWTSVSRAVRSPTRADDDVQLVFPQQFPGFFPLIQGNRGFVSEDLLAFEAGMRAQPTDKFSWDLAAFWHDYSDLQTTVTGLPFPVFPGPPAPPFFVPQTISNGPNGQTYGFELFANYQVAPCWKLFGSYSFLRVELDPEATGNGDSPRNQLYLWSSWDLCCDWRFDAIWRYVDSLPNQGVPGYNTMDCRLAWRPNRDLEWVLAGRNLLGKHFEFGNDTFTGNLATQVQPEVYGMVVWRY